MAMDSSGSGLTSPSSLTTAAPFATTTSPVPLTTVFTPAVHCSGFTFSSPSYYIWYNEPVVATSITFSDCYPSQFLNGYSSTIETSSQRSIAPLLGPIICPKGWVTIPNAQTSTYVACCPSGFSGIAPPASIMHQRPSYGGTCYSDFTSGQWLTVTEYNEESIVGTKTLSESSSGQVYAHVIDGLVSQEVLRTSSPATVEASLTTASYNAQWTDEPTRATASPATPNTPATRLSSSATEAIVISSSIFGVALIGLVIFFFLRRCSPARKATTKGRFEVEKDGITVQTYEKDPWGDRHSSMDKPRTELVGSAVVHEMCYELEDSQIKRDLKRSHCSSGPPGHPSRSKG